MNARPLSYCTSRGLWRTVDRASCGGLIEDSAPFGVRALARGAARVVHGVVGGARRRSLPVQDRLG